ncbi:MAG TPA: class E sortase [Candidatus Saccharimonadales bacterium]|nr:class E sortase [Candidatus Saccharimonadales bacterium]
MLFDTTPRRRYGWILPLVAVIAVGVGLYLLLLSTAPSLPAISLFGMSDVDIEASLAEKPGARGDRLYIPQLAIDVPIGEEENALERGAWHRVPENGNPIKGGNFVLSAHRFVIGWTPQQTRNNSPFYRLDQLLPGNLIYVDYKSKRYTYRVDRLYPVPSTATEIEAPSNAAKLTLYSCDLRGESAGRLVVEAVPQR